ncbi:hypothetical protein K470DRAFT_258955 [Piedraia hortae CBS 480.64]|uniref:Ecp2 effector protein domain-containing protein n=1 Tax=Piedraia hortae CBS 480.64 TaxID=1314780 RepID=A0A6A7BWH2_9PEZI|nr:hypothetical protein K470DRAFT_258955 [Piedraia hortae CBS 480.64]
MSPATVLTTVLFFLTLTHASIIISPLTAELLPEKYSIQFTQHFTENISDGPSDTPYTCVLEWPLSSKPPTCYTTCQGYARARITPGTFNGIEDFSIDVWQDYRGIAYWHNVHGTVEVKVGILGAGYFCDGDRCEIKGKGFDTGDSTIFGDDGYAPELAERDDVPYPGILVC